MSTVTLTPTLIEPVFLRVPEAMQVLRLSRTTIYELIRAKRLIACKEGASTLIPVDSINNYKALLLKESETAR